MATYKIISDNSTLGKAGSTVSDHDLVGLSIEALIAGNQIERVVSSFAKRDKSDKKESE